MRMTDALLDEVELRMLDRVLADEFARTTGDQLTSEVQRQKRQRLLDRRAVLLGGGQ